MTPSKRGLAKPLPPLLALVALSALWGAGCRDGGADPLAPESTDPTLPATGHTTPYTVADARSANRADHEAAGDYAWTSAVTVTLSGSAISVDGPGASASGTTLTIKSAGTYALSGSLSDGQIVVDAGSALVRLVLGGVDVTSTKGAPLRVSSAGKTVIVLADNTVNRVADAATRASGDEANAAVFSEDDLSIGGGGALTVVGSYEDGIASKDGLVIRSGTLAVSAKDDGIRGKDYVVVRGGDIEVTAGGDGVKTDNTEDDAVGYVLVEAGSLAVTAGGDAVQADTDVLVSGGTLSLTAGGGSSKIIPATLSAKGLKAGVALVVDLGTITVDAADDALHSNGFLVYNGGTATLSSGDDGIHADKDLVVNGGRIDILKSYEGIENTKSDMTINGGDIRITARDDGINLAGDGDMMGGGPGGMGGGGTTTKYTLHINGGYIVSDAIGDGMDINGSVAMSGGSLIVHGPTANNNGPLDYQGTFTMTGGFLVAAGSSGMAQAPGTTSTQPAVLMTFSTARPAGTLIHVESTSGQDVLSFVPRRAYQSLAFSSGALKTGTTYNVYVGGSAGGTPSDGLYPAGSYTPGTLLTSFTVSGMVTRVSR
jgi:hypothetical protein